MRERNLAAVAAILNFEEPAAKARLDRKHRIAHRGLLHLRHHGSVELRRNPPDGGALVEDIAERCHRHP
jgi:hypothetical protein